MASKQVGEMRRRSNAELVNGVSWGHPTRPSDYILDPSSNVAGDVTTVMLISFVRIRFHGGRSLEERSRASQLFARWRWSAQCLQPSRELPVRSMIARWAHQ
jgi:hypothetical protein